MDGSLSVHLVCWFFLTKHYTELFNNCSKNRSSCCMPRTLVFSNRAVYVQWSRPCLKAHFKVNRWCWIHVNLISKCNIFIDIFVIYHNKRIFVSKIHLLIIHICIFKCNWHYYISIKNKESFITFWHLLYQSQFIIFFDWLILFCASLQYTIKTTVLGYFF